LFRHKPVQVEIGDPAVFFVFILARYLLERFDFKFHSFSGISWRFPSPRSWQQWMTCDPDGREPLDTAPPASLKAINNLKPVLGLIYGPRPRNPKKMYSIRLTWPSLYGKFIKTPTVVTPHQPDKLRRRRNRKLKILDGLALHERKKARMEKILARLTDFLLVKPFVLISTRDTTHASASRP